MERERERERGKEGKRERDDGAGWRCQGMGEGGVKVGCRGWFLAMVLLMILLVSILYVDLWVE